MRKGKWLIKPTLSHLPERPSAGIGTFPRTCIRWGVAEASQGRSLRLSG